MIKKTLLSITTTCLLLTSTPYSVNATGIPTVDVAAIVQQVMAYQQMLQDYAMQIQQYENMVTQLQQQVRMVEMQTTNLKNLGSFNWDNLGSIIKQQKRIMNNVGGISYDLGNISNKFENTYKDFNGYENDFSNATNEKQRNKIYSDKYKEITELNQNTLNGTFQKLENSYNQIDREDQILDNLKSRSESAEGNLQVLQASNDLLTFQIDEIRKLKTTVMDQSNAMTNYMAMQNNEKILQQSKNEALQERDSNSGYKKADDISIFKLPGGR
ncbi:P-type conjugative transfer protein TrbJ [Aliarcobacter butzleri]|uniref:P-type conjugative transfer protein TrbJ n=1 Tax=Aliarcobacter butzleri TaxID=28197 RepID=A0AAW6VG75_9BACT|nr:P-type conjugative transfer protein TrbJ [Aliarcobacter butzleri]MCG3674326.1 P-type conjugative transfer protein TrbJ [Aliarcobacter butzleri]MCG3681017.1 P-type conjugative transfer protein TrbJ [Aliarcobacter butzleri]MDK2041519.1 P-type conjugative transfer protein TrbJ [Aliarcobacter butzleri]MDK2096750.1 P-type conjugative transfer protein TrbJ [Aliarcobacter butzleri]MDN5047575.1 P-type conjugative transfer protein TrbJ [Aliarcobacter butzleri]